MFLVRLLRTAVLTMSLSAGCTAAEPPSSEQASPLTRDACSARPGSGAAEIPVRGVAWRQALLEFAQREVKHPSWGLAHAKRDLLLSLEIAHAEELSVDEDVLFAAAFLHDLGGLPGHAEAGVDHAVRSAELAPAILSSVGFPVEKIERVQEVIRAHTYYSAQPPSAAESIVFRDADVLDFLGAIGLARFAAAAEKDLPDLATSFGFARQLTTQLPPKLLTETAKCDGARRAALLTTILDAAVQETFGGTHY